MKISRRTTLIASTVALISPVPLSVLQTPAYADAPSTHQVISVPMYVSGFDPVIAKKYGYPTTAPSQEASDGSVTPAGTVGGTCGASYVTLTDVGTRKYSMDTGFGVAVAAVGYSWSVHVTSPGYDKTWNYSGGLALRTTWTNSPKATAVVPNAANVFAIASGKAYLSNGAICSSNNPTDIIAVY